MTFWRSAFQKVYSLEFKRIYSRKIKLQTNYKDITSIYNLRAEWKFTTNCYFHTWQSGKTFWTGRLAHLTLLNLIFCCVKRHILFQYLQNSRQKIVQEMPYYKCLKVLFIADFTNWLLISICSEYALLIRKSKISLLLISR